MKFGKNISLQQAQRTDLHYLQYKLLKKILKRSTRSTQADGSSRAAYDHHPNQQSFEKMLEDEIDEVNISFSEHANRLQDEITALSSEGSLDELRKFAVWNAVGVVKILKKRNKLRATSDPQGDLQDSSIDMDEERSRWLRRQKFFTGTDFAELQASIESLSNALCRERLHELGPEKLPSQLVLAEDDDCPVGMFRDERCPICLEKCSDVVELSTCEHRFCWKCFVLGPIAFAPGEYRFDRCPICRREQPLDPTVNFKTDTNSNSTTNMLLRMAKYVEVEDPPKNEQVQSSEPSSSSFFSTLPATSHKSAEGSVSSEKSSQQNAAWTGNSAEAINMSNPVSACSLRRDQSGFSPAESWKPTQEYRKRAGCVVFNEAAPICDDKISQNGDDANEDDIWRRYPQQQPTTCGGFNRLSSQIEGMFLLLALRAVPALIFLMCTILLGVYDHDLPAYTRADVTAMIWVTLADWAYNIAMSTGLVMLSPLWVTMGTVPSVPVALIFDMFAKGLTLSVGAWTGVLLTAVGFIVFNVISSREESGKQREAVGLPSDQSD
ncbi:hypothetical protein Pmar_PMAR001884 [Perkinsus marinus ATCC 50983]|uniref:RING-type domain-containing protein n=1 Tax=Perkinsus marinus (strain ATCC 50983 / TXsc) TaxID=423536 RepID=C5LPW6_PERM5|nr:hypothetical protein Pmar_PMAR001884 [Perkinsus marinus ATCC 50983]EER01226.1 hypothetical protein Pmar_PMAR001884 [Perkinsus marinus ATCC 50983]|eukprot:XP_002768508.1 hypothetical protein Pmar_PMAR001884 [Perkinsus marinus ATCC 50983]